jgi:hypothetical protein
MITNAAQKYMDTQVHGCAEGTPQKANRPRKTGSGAAIDYSWASFCMPGMRNFKWDSVKTTLHWTALFHIYYYLDSNPTLIAKATRDLWQVQDDLASIIAEGLDTELLSVAASSTRDRNIEKRANLRFQAILQVLNNLVALSQDPAKETSFWLTLNNACTGFAEKSSSHWQKKTATTETITLPGIAAVIV